MNIDINLLNDLGLPNPDNLELDDADLLAVYRGFCASLSYTECATSISVDADYLELGDTRGDIPPEQLPSLKLLSALIGRGNHYPYLAIKRRLAQVGRVTGRRGGKTGEIQRLSVARGMKAFVAFHDSPDFERLTPNRVRPQSIAHLSSTLNSAPGYSWSSGIQIRTWSRKWALVSHWQDCEDEEVRSFPTILGFAQRDALPESAGWILAKEPLRFAYSAADNAGDPFLLACWERHGPEGEYNLAEVFLELDKDLQEAFLREIRLHGGSKVFLGLQDAAYELQDCDFPMPPYFDCEDLRAILSLVRERFIAGGLVAIQTLPDEIRSGREQSEE